MSNVILKSDLYGMKVDDDTPQYAVEFLREMQEGIVQDRLDDALDASANAKGIESARLWWFGVL